MAHTGSTQAVPVLMPTTIIKKDGERFMMKYEIF